MGKIIIPKSSLPNLSDDQTNRFRFRIINKNRNLASEWSVIGEVKREVDDIDYELPGTFSVEPLQRSHVLSWEVTANIGQEYDIYRKQYASSFDFTTGSTSYASDALEFYESTADNYTIVHGKFSERVGINIPNILGQQLMVRNFTYPRNTFSSWQVESCERVSNYLKVYISNDTITDFDRSYNENNSVYADLTIGAESGQIFSTQESMEVFNGIKSIVSVDKVSSPGSTILSIYSSGSDIGFFKPSYGTITRIAPDPLFVSDMTDFA